MTAEVAQKSNKKYVFTCFSWSNQMYTANKNTPVALSYLQSYRLKTHTYSGTDTDPNLFWTFRKMVNLIFLDFTVSRSRHYKRGVRNTPTLKPARCVCEFLSWPRFRPRLSDKWSVSEQSILRSVDFAPVQSRWNPCQNGNLFCS